MRNTAKILAFVLAGLLLAGTSLYAADYEDATSISSGNTEEGMIRSGEHDAWFKVSTNSAGYLAVIVRANDDATITVYGPKGLEPRLGGVDGDLYGDYGAEEIIVEVPGRGTYYIQVAMSGDEAIAYGDVDFDISVAFVSQPDVAVEISGDDITSGAITLRMGQAEEGTLNYEGGDRIDWFKVNVTDRGVLTLVLKGEDEVVDIDMFLHDKDQPVLNTLDYSTDYSSDEQITFEIEEPGTYYVRLKALDGGEAGYKLMSSFLEY
jgi:hypothetical protein